MPAPQPAPVRPRAACATGPVRKALVGMSLLGLAALAACRAIPVDADPSPSEIADRTSHAGEFSGTYQDGLPVYLFPTIYVIGKRNAD